MFGFIKGIIAYKNNNVVVLDNNGVGYEMIVSSMCFNNIGTLGEEAKLWTQLNVKQDEITIIGFQDLQEREVFRKLLLVNGVGPKMALTILGGITAQDLTVAIATQQADFLKGIKGVGTKIRDRIMLELKEKMEDVGTAELTNVGTPHSNLFDSAVAILMDWGVQKINAQQIVQSNLTAEDTLETLLGKAFKDMGR